MYTGWDLNPGPVNRDNVPAWAGTLRMGYVRTTKLNVFWTVIADFVLSSDSVSDDLFNDVWHNSFVGKTKICFEKILIIKINSLSIVGA